MKKYLLSLTFLSFILFSNISLVIAQSKSGWEYVNFVPGALFSVSFVDSLNGWAVNSDELIHTNNGGENWIYQNVQREYGEFMRTVFFLNENLGWIGGDEIWHTQNGGISWDLQTADLNKAKYRQINTIIFLNENIGWASGDSSLVLKTIDGGLHWESNSIGDEGNTVSSISFLDSLNGWAVGFHEIFRTKDSGVTWDTVYSDVTEDLYFGSIYFLDSLNGWTAANNGRILITNNGGMSWDTTTIDLEMFYQSYFEDIHFVDTTKGIIVGSGVDNFFNSYSLIYKSTDGGKNWIVSNYDYSLAGLRSLSYADEATFYSVGDNSLLKTSNLGDTWSNQLSFVKTIIYDIQFFDNSHGWAIGQDNDAGKGVIMQSVDGGKNWENSYFKDYRFEDASFIDELTGWVVGPGIVLHTNNGGNNWEEQNYPENFDGAFSVDFVDTNNGWAVGWNEPIIKTSDGGNNWQVVTSELYNLRKVYFINKDYGWAAGTLWERDSLNNSHQYGHILRTTNGGQTWQEVKTGEGHYLYSVFSIDQNTGWAIGSDSQNDTNVVLNSKDGGVTWNVQAQLPHRPNDIFFIDSNNGWIATEFGEIYFSSDGGNNWTRQFLTQKFANSLNTIHFIDGNTGWAAGFDGLIVKTNSGGVTSITNSNIDFIPSEFHLEQNYPNPFNPTTTIQFTVPSLEKTVNNVTLKVYDVLGRELKTLVNEKMEEGNYEVQFNANNIASGIYFYELRF